LLSLHNWPELTEGIEQILERKSALIVPESTELYEQAHPINYLLMQK